MFKVTLPDGVLAEEHGKSLGAFPGHGIVHMRFCEGYEAECIAMMKDRAVLSGVSGALLIFKLDGRRIRCTESSISSLLLLLLLLLSTLPAMTSFYTHPLVWASSLSKDSAIP